MTNSDLKLNRKIKEAQEVLGLNFNNSKLLRRALTHPSFAAEQEENMDDNERLEYLGDAVLELATSLYLFKNYPEVPEGELTQKRSILVNTRSLAEVARELSIPNYILLSHGEKKIGGYENDTILANVMEAVLGAIIVDKGWDKAKDFIQENVIKFVEKKGLDKKTYNPKGKLQEILQSQGKDTPMYKVEEEKGPDHDKNFVVSVHSGSKKIGEGSGKSKHLAEEQAARKALDNLE